MFTHFSDETGSEKKGNKEVMLYMPKSLLSGNIKNYLSQDDFKA